MMSPDDHKLCELVDEMAGGCLVVIDKALSTVECPAMQNAAVSSLGFTIASSTLRTVTDEDDAKTIARDLVATFAAECACVIAEIWADREAPQ